MRTSISRASRERLLREQQWQEMSDADKHRRVHMRPATLATKVEKVKQSDALTNAINDSLPASATILVQQGDEQWNGSGFLLNNGRMITAFHVVEGVTAENGVINVVFDNKSNEAYSAQVAAANPQFDLAIIVLNTVPNVEPMMLANPKAITIGEPIAVIGSPGGWQDVVTTGRVAAIHQDVSQLEAALSDFILIDADIEPGSSGSMVIDEDGNIVGMVSAIIGEHADIGLGKKAVIPVDKILQLIKQSH